MELAEQQRFLEAFDESLGPLQFKRRARAQEWSTVSGSDRLWLHLNFGLGVLNPTFGVEYADLRKTWSTLPGAVFGTTMTLSTLFEPARQYSSDDDAERLVGDWQERGVPGLKRLQDRRLVLALLESSVVRDWPVASFSHRIRLAPLLAGALGDAADVLEMAEQFAVESAGKDQILPSYSVYVEHLRGTLAG